MARWSQKAAVGSPLQAVSLRPTIEARKVTAGTSQQAASPCSSTKAGTFAAGSLQSLNTGTSVSIDLSESSSNSDVSCSDSHQSDSDCFHDEPEQGSLVKLRDSAGWYDTTSVVLGMEGSHIQVQMLSNGDTMSVLPTDLDSLPMQDEIARWMLELHGGVGKTKKHYHYHNMASALRIAKRVVFKTRKHWRMCFVEARNIVREAFYETSCG